MKKIAAVIALLLSTPAHAVVIIPPRPVIIPRPVFVPRPVPMRAAPVRPAPVERAAPIPFFVYVPIAPHSSVMRKCDPRTDRRKCR